MWTLSQRFHMTLLVSGVTSIPPNPPRGTHAEYVTLDQSCFVLQAINLVTFSFQSEHFFPFFG